MATYYARKAGNIDGNDVWATTPSGAAGAVTFASGDVLVANSFAVTVNVTTNLGTGTVTNDNRDGATQGGSFTLSNGVTLTANVVAGNAASTNCVNFNTSAPASAAIVGNVTAGGGGASAVGVANGSTGALTITGTVTGGSSSSSFGVNNITTGSLVVVGNCVGGSNTACAGVNNASTGPVTITGNCTGGSSTDRGHGVRNAQSSNTVFITGTCTGGTNAASHGASNESGGTITITGTAVGAAGIGANNLSTGTMTVTRAKGGPLNTSNVGVGSPSSGSTSVLEVEYGDLGASPTSGAIRFTANTSNVALLYIPSAAKKTLVDANAGGLMPAASNVRSGVVYNGGNSTGTCAVPGSASVLVGVPVDNTVGTAAVASADIQSGCAAALSAFSSGRLANVATVASTGQQLADALGQ
jgi:hypothetical protein